MVYLPRVDSPGEFGSPVENPPHGGVPSQDCHGAFLRGAGRSLVVLEPPGANPCPGTEGPGEATPGEKLPSGTWRAQKSAKIQRRRWVSEGEVSSQAERLRLSCSSPEALPGTCAVPSPHRGPHTRPGAPGQPWAGGSAGHVRSEKGSGLFTCFADAAKICLQHHRHLHPGWRRWVKGGGTMPK